MVALCAAAFLLWGVMLVVLGASHEQVARDLDLGLADWGLLSAALPLGAGVGVTAAGPLFDRLPRRWLFVAASGIAGAMLLTVHDDMTLGGAVARIALAGVGAGAYNTIVNAALAEHYGERSATPVMLVHATATLGAIAGAPAAGAIASALHWTLPFRGLGVAHLLVAFASLLATWPEQPRAERARSRPGRALIPYLCAAFAYVGIEATATAFAVPYATAALALPGARGRYAISALWLGVLASRMIVLAGRRFLDRGALVGAGILGALLIVAGTASGFGLVELFFGAVGLAVGFVYPLLMTQIGHRFVDSRGTAAGLAGGAGAAGGFAVPWLTGAIGERLDVATALGSLAAWSIVIAIAGAFVHQSQR
jgi:MFS family permease